VRRSVTSWDIETLLDHRLIAVRFVFWTIVTSSTAAAKVISAAHRMSMMMGAHELAMRNTRRYGGYVVHSHGARFFVGLAGSAFTIGCQRPMILGIDELGPYTLVLQSADTKPEQNYTAQRNDLEVLKGNKQLMMMYPKSGVQGAEQASGTMVAIYSTLR